MYDIPQQDSHLIILDSGEVNKDYAKCLCAKLRRGFDNLRKLPLKRL